MERGRKGELLYFLWRPSIAFRYFAQLVLGVWGCDVLVLAYCCKQGGQQERPCMLLMSELVVPMPSCSSWREEGNYFDSFVCCRSYSIEVSERNYAEGNELKLIQHQETHQLLNQAVRPLFGAVKEQGPWESHVCERRLPLS